jgi:GNAT superfamily N-acetyltransferase
MRTIQTKKYSLTIRTEPSQEDSGHVRQLVSETGFFRPDEIEIAVELVDERIKRGHKSGYHFFLADIDNKLAGYSCFGLIPCSLLSWDLYWIVTRKDLQGQGIGKVLLKLTEDEILKQGGKNVIIETSSKELYQSTQQFYSKNNYELKACFQDFYDFEDDKLVYIKRL